MIPGDCKNTGKQLLIFFSKLNQTTFPYLGLLMQIKLGDVRLTEIQSPADSGYKNEQF